MKCQLLRQSLCLLAVVGWSTLSQAQVSAPSDEEAIDFARKVIKSDRRAVVTEALQLTGEESARFWPLYDEYRRAMDKVGDGVVKLVQEYRDVYPNIPADRARQMLKDLLGLEKQQLAVRTEYLKKFGKVLPADKTLRFAQVENRLDLASRIGVAANIPLLPIEGQLTGKSSGATVVTEGVPGGAVVETYEFTATVVGIDQANRKVTLLSPQGIKETVKVGPDAINFPQLRVGDVVRISATRELVVEMGGPGESPKDGAAALVSLAPKGSKPGGIAAETRQVAGTISEINLEKRTATVRFDDGSTRTFPVRKDVDLGRRKVGEKVVFRLTETIALNVTKP